MDNDETTQNADDVNDNADLHDHPSAEWQRSFESKKDYHRDLFSADSTHELDSYSRSQERFAREAAQHIIRSGVLGDEERGEFAVDLGGRVAKGGGVGSEIVLRVRSIAPPGSLTTEGQPAEKTDRVAKGEVYPPGEVDHSKDAGSMSELNFNVSEINNNTEGAQNLDAPKNDPSEIGPKV